VEGADEELASQQGNAFGTQFVQLVQTSGFQLINVNNVAIQLKVCLKALSLLRLTHTPSHPARAVCPAAVLGACCSCAGGPRAHKCLTHGSPMQHCLTVQL
jgi:hypothetical protein